jgi:hypothetical protein
MPAAFFFLDTSAKIVIGVDARWCEIDDVRLLGIARALPKARSIKPRPAALLDRHAFAQ